jgi:hypothetical protein
VEVRNAARRGVDLSLHGIGHRAVLLAAHFQLLHAVLRILCNSPLCFLAETLPSLPSPCTACGHH